MASFLDQYIIKAILKIQRKIMTKLLARIMSSEIRESHRSKNIEKQGIIG